MKIDTYTFKLHVLLEDFIAFQSTALLYYVILPPNNIKHAFSIRFYPLMFSEIQGTGLQYNLMNTAHLIPNLLHIKGFGAPLEVRTCSSFQPLCDPCFLSLNIKNGFILCHYIVFFSVNKTHFLFDIKYVTR